MATLVNLSQRAQPGASVVSLTTVQRAILQLGMPILDAGAVAAYKRRARLGMLWRTLRWPLLGMATLVAFECLGRQWGRAAVVGAAAALLASLFAWLVHASDLRWQTIDYTTYRSLQTVPAHVSDAASALVSRGISEEQIGVEYLKNDPILFVLDGEFAWHGELHFGAARYDLVIW